MSRLVQMVILDEQAELVSAALTDALKSEDLDEAQQGALSMLEQLFAAASDDPSKFPLTGKKAASLARTLRIGKGPAQPQSRKNKRKARQESRTRTAKMNRKLRKKIAEGYNEARETMEKEYAEAEQAHAELVARLEKEPKFNVKGMDGTVLIRDVPKSMIEEVPAAADQEIILS